MTVRSQSAYAVLSLVTLGWSMANILSCICRTKECSDLDVMSSAKAASSPADDVLALLPFESPLGPGLGGSGRSTLSASHPSSLSLSWSAAAGLGPAPPLPEAAFTLCSHIDKEMKGYKVESRYRLTCIYIENTNNNKIKNVGPVLLIQWTLVITSSLGPENFACYNETLLYQGYKNSTIEEIWNCGTTKITFL